VTFFGFFPPTAVFGFYFPNTDDCCWWKNAMSATLSVLYITRKLFFHFSIFPQYSVFIFQILLLAEKCNERDPQCAVNYPKVIFPFFHFSTAFGFYYPNTVRRKKWQKKW
jgi:hypothetical protein